MLRTQLTALALTSSKGHGAAQPLSPSIRPRLSGPLTCATAPYPTSASFWQVHQLQPRMRTLQQLELGEAAWLRLQPHKDRGLGSMPDATSMQGLASRQAAAQQQPEQPLHQV